MRKISLLFAAVALCFSCGGEVQPTKNVYSLVEGPDCHDHTSGAGHHQDSGVAAHNGYGYGHHKCERKCYKKEKVCKEVKFCNPAYSLQKCNKCKQSPGGCEKNVCKKFVTRKKCWWKKVNVECPPCQGEDCPPQCKGEDCPCVGENCPPPPPVCGDQTCDPNETCESCPSDCGQCPPPPPRCGDETCDSSESCETCSQDCGNCPPPPPACGDQTCDPTESCESCPADCGQCPPPPPVCGDDLCDSSEDCESCPADCGECPSPPDAGTPDSGTSEPDAGTPSEPDAGVPSGRDTGTPSRPDAGVPSEPDVGTPSEPDAGVPNEVDAAATPDVGNRPPLTQPFDPDVELVGGGGCSINGNGANVGLGIFLVLGVFAMFFRKKFAALFAALLLVGSMSLATTANAAPPVGNFRSAPTVNDYFTTQRPETLPHLGLNVQAQFNYSHRPLRLITKPGGDTISSVIRFRHNLEVALALGLFNRIELGLVVPAQMGQGAGDLTAIGYTGTTDYFDRADLGDARLVPKVHLLSAGPLSLGLSAPLTLPTGDRVRLLGDNGSTITPTLLIGLNSKHISFGLNAGVRFRADQELQFRSQNLNLDDEFVYGLGVRIPLLGKHGVLRKLDLIGDIWGAVGLGQQDKEELPLEAMGGLRAHVKHGLVFNVGAGGGVTKGYGTPQYRVMWGVAWEFGGPKPCPVCKKPEVRIVERVKTRTVTRTVVKVVNRVVVLPMVYFDTDQSTLRPDAVAALQQVVRVLRENRDITRVRVEGHCDRRASDKYNEALATRRVQAVVDYLSKRGISLSRLVPRPLGEKLADQGASSAQALQNDRRVEFKVLKVN